MESLRITDIFRTAALISMGCSLIKVQHNSQSKGNAFFLIQGESLNELDQTYRTGQALIEPLRLRENLNYVKDCLFEKKREHEGRSGYDRTKTNRFYKKQCRY